LKLSRQTLNPMWDQRSRQNRQRRFSAPFPPGLMPPEGSRLFFGSSCLAPVGVGNFQGYIGLRCLDQPHRWRIGEIRRLWSKTSRALPFEMRPRNKHFSVGAEMAITTTDVALECVWHLPLLVAIHSYVVLHLPKEVAIMVFLGVF
jgi:hypothetical protein